MIFAISSIIMATWLQPELAYSYISRALTFSFAYWLSVSMLQAITWSWQQVSAWRAGDLTTCSPARSWHASRTICGDCWWADWGVICRWDRVPDCFEHCGKSCEIKYYLHCIRYVHSSVALHHLRQHKICCWLSAAFRNRYAICSRYIMQGLPEFTSYHLL